MNEIKKNILVIARIFFCSIFMLVWFPLLFVNNSSYDWVNYLSDWARLIAGVVGAWTVFYWILKKSGYIDKDK